MSSQKSAKKRRILAYILIVVLVLVMVSSLLVYLKIKRIAASIQDSALKATSQNTPLVDE